MTDSPTPLSDQLTAHKTSTGFGDARLASMACDLANDPLFLHRSSVRNWSTGASKSVKNWRQLAAIATVLRLGRSDADALLAAAGWPSIEELGRTATDDDRRFVAYWDDEPVAEVAATDEVTEVAITNAPADKPAATNESADTAEPVPEVVIRGDDPRAVAIEEPTETVEPDQTPAPVAVADEDNRHRRGGMLALLAVCAAAIFGLIGWLSQSDGGNGAEVLAKALTPTPAATATPASTIELNTAEADPTAEPEEAEPARPVVTTPTPDFALATPTPRPPTPTPASPPAATTTPPSSTNTQTNPPANDATTSPTATPVVTTPTTLPTTSPTTPPVTPTETPTPTPTPTPTEVPNTPVPVAPPSAVISAPQAGSSLGGMPGTTTLSGTAQYDAGVRDVRLRLTRLRAETYPQTYWDHAAGTMVAANSEWDLGVSSADGSAINWSYTVPAGLPTGQYKLIVSTLGADGVNTANGSSLEFSINNGLPVSTINSPAGNVAAGTAPVFSGSSTFALGIGDVVITVARSNGGQLYWNGTAWQEAFVQFDIPVDQPGAATTTWSHALPALEAGTYRVRVIARSASTPPRNEPDGGPYIDFTVS